MKKFRFLLLDANVVIELFRLGIWDRVVDRCDIHLGETVKREVQYWQDDEGERHDIDLTPYEDSGRIATFDVSLADLDAFTSRFGLVYLEKLDAGETEALAYMLNSAEKYQLCSADKITYRVLGALSREEHGVSLEEVLGQVGLGRHLQGQFSRAYREHWTRKGFEQGLQGMALK